MAWWFVKPLTTHYWTVKGSGISTSPTAAVFSPAATMARIVSLLEFSCCLGAELRPAE
jgi:hypothetical protein